MGTPYCTGASVRGVGTDCVGLIVGVGRDLGVLEVDLPIYRQTDTDLLDSLLRESLDPAPLDDAEILVFQMAGNRHLAICLGDTIAHVYGRKYGVTSHPFSDAWRRRVVSGWRYRSVNG